MYQRAYLPEQQGEELPIDDNADVMHGVPLQQCADISNPRGEPADFLCVLEPS